jgi:YD repeat-containing protein
MGQNIEIVKLQVRRGPEAELPILDSGEIAMTTDTSKVFIGTGSMNIEISSKNYVNSQVLSVNTGGTVDLSVKADKTYVDQQVIDLKTVNNYSTSYGYNPDGSVATETVKDASNNTIKTTTYNYDASGNVSTSVSTVNGKQVTTTYNYDASGNIISTTNTVI